MHNDTLTNDIEQDLVLYKLWNSLRQAQYDISLPLSDTAKTLINQLIKELEK